MGGSDLDLCDVELSNPVTQLNVYSVMGGGQIRVPDGVEVQVSKLGLMGGNDVRLGDEVSSPGAPLIRIRLVSLMGAPAYVEAGGSAAPSASKSASFASPSAATSSGPSGRPRTSRKRGHAPTRRTAVETTIPASIGISVVR